MSYAQNVGLWMALHPNWTGPKDREEALARLLLVSRSINASGPFTSDAPEFEWIVDIHACWFRLGEPWPSLSSPTTTKEEA